jgi:indole-3-glycerol phosphate synthase
MTILDEIIKGVREDLEERKRLTSLVEMINLSESVATGPALDVMKYFTSGAFGIIAEIKRSSPSKGALAKIDDPAALAKSYQDGGACAVSVLTESRRFNGSLADLAAVRKAVTIPILRKEFIIDSYQIYEARVFGADIILLIVAALSDEEILEFSMVTSALGMRTLIEVHDEDEISRVLNLSRQSALDIDLLGINARNLKTLAVDPESFARLSPTVPATIPLIAESGISNSAEVGALSARGASGILVGEALVKDGNPAATIKEFLNRAEQERVRRLQP